MLTRRLATLGAATAALLLLPAAVSAAPPPGTITIIDRERGSDVFVDGQPVVCEFAIELDFEIDAPMPVVGWVIKVWASTAFDGETVLAGSDGPTDDGGRLRQPRDGWVTLPDGSYNLLVDDETPVDKSFLRQRFTVDCDADATPAPTEDVAPTASPAPTEDVDPTSAPTPTEAPLGGVLPTEGVATKSPDGQGAVLPAEEVSEPTLPPTDATSEPPTTSDPVGGIAFTFLLLSLAVLALTPARRQRVVTDRH